MASHLKFLRLGKHVWRQRGGTSGHTLTFLCAAFKHTCTHLTGLSTLLIVSAVSCYSSSILWNAVLVPALFLGHRSSSCAVVKPNLYEQIAAIEYEESVILTNHISAGRKSAWRAKQCMCLFWQRFAANPSFLLFQHTLCVSFPHQSHRDV